MKQVSELEEIRVPYDPKEAGLPYTAWRPGQRDGIVQIVNLWRQGVNAVMVNGPTGSGKSGLAVGAGNVWLDALEAEDAPITVLTQTKDLQEQYTQYFKQARAATGRSNWDCADSTKRANQCPNIGISPCEPSCPYYIQRQAAYDSKLRVINYAYYGATGTLFDAPVMVADEADYLGDLLIAAHAVDLTKIVLSSGLEVPQEVIHPTTHEDFLSKLEDLRYNSALPDERETLKRALSLLRSQRFVVKGVGDILRPWPESKVVQGFIRQPTIIMSATVFAPQYWSKEWGIPVGWVELPCLVPASARPIRLLNIKKLNRNSSDEDWQEIISAVDKIIGQKLPSKGLIHSVSNKITDLILSQSRYSSLMFRAEGNTRLKAIREFIEADTGVLVGPNLTRGLDLKDDLCRWIIFPKVPYPNMADPRVQEMLKGGEDRYRVETLGAIIQGAGRGIRHVNDSCETFILDSGAGWLLKQTREWQPTWFREAIEWHR